MLNLEKSENPNIKNTQCLRKCCTCGAEKPFSEFHKNSSMKNGIHYSCKRCRAKYRAENSDKIKAGRKRYYATNKWKIQKYFNENREKIRATQKKYNLSQRGRDASRKATAKYTATKNKAIIDDFNPNDVFNRDKYICQSCGCKTRPDYKNHYHPKYPNLDHIIPLSKGGEHSMKNTQCLCRQCNIEKRNNQKNDQLLLFGY